jgi:hypothetical protein
VILFGLSTDYEVFMLSRVKEYYRETNNNEEAVASGLEHTAGVITAAGLILVGTFGSFASANVVTIKEIGLGLAIGVFLDSTIVRIIMVPATMRLMGATNWWMPDWLKRIVPELSEGPAHVPANAQTPEPALAMAGAGAAAVVAAPPPPPATPPAPPPAQAPAVAPVPAPAPVIHYVDDAGVVSPLTPQTPPASRRRRLPLTGRLHRVRGTSAAEIIDLSPSRPLTIGRDDGNDIQLLDGRVSRRHGLIEYADGQYVIVDLQSANGIIVNGTRIEPDPDRLALHDGDLIEIGTMGVVAFRVELNRPS